MLWRKFANALIERALRFRPGAKIIVENAGGAAPTEISLTELLALNNVDAADLQKIDGITNGTPAANKALVADANVGVGAFRESGRNLRKQAAPAAKTTSTTLTAAEIMAGLLTGNQGGAAAASYTLPLASALESALLAVHPGLQNDDSFDFTVINISTVAAEDITILTNTGWTLVGNMVVESNEATAQKAPVGTFRARRTAANTYSLYRVA